MASLPAGLAALLLRRIEALPPEARWVLEAASVVGEAFAVAAVAAGVQRPIEDVEAMCEGLAAQRSVLVADGVGPDGVVYVHRVAHRRQRAVGAGFALVGVAPDDVINLLVHFALGVEPAFDDLDAIQVGTDGIFERRNQEVRFAGGRITKIVTHWHTFCRSAAAPGG